MAGRSEQWLKNLGRRWLRSAAPPRGVPPTIRDLDNIARILVVRLDDRLGNVVLLTPLLVGLKGRFSRARLSCCLASRYWDMRDFIPSVDEFIPFDRAAMAHNPLRIRPLIRRLQSEKFDLVFDASDESSESFNHLVVTALSGGKFRVGHDRGEAGRYYELPVPVPSAPRHAADMHLDLLRAVTPIRSTPRPLLKPPKNDTGYAANLRRELGDGPERPIVVMHPGGRGPKRWPASEFVSVAQEVAADGVARVVMVWGPADDDAAREVMDTACGTIHPLGILSFDDLVSLICDASLFLSGDCGPMHLASALGTPVVAVFRVSNADKYKPIGEFDVVFDEQRQPVRTVDVAAAVVNAAHTNRNMVSRRREFIKQNVQSAASGDGS